MPLDTPPQILQGPAKRALLICEYGPQLGQGHLLRSSAFAQHLTQRGWDCQLLAFCIHAPADSGATEQPPPEAQEGFQGFQEFQGFQGFPDQAVEAEGIPAQSLAQWHETSQLQQLSRWWTPNTWPSKKVAPAPLGGGSAPPRWDLVLIDSYQLPLAFYQDCAQTQLTALLLAMDDFERLPYPHAFSVIQAALPLDLPLDLPSDPPPAPPPVLAPGPASKQPQYLRGLAYQVLRAEFSQFAKCQAAQEEARHQAPQTAYWLFIPGSAFQDAQVKLMARQFLGQLPAKALLYILASEKHNSYSDSSGKVRVYRRQSAAELCQLLAHAQRIFCACSQSLLEALCVAQSPIVALETADNQEPLARLLQSYLPICDLRRALLAPLSSLEEQLETTALLRYPLDGAWEDWEDPKSPEDPKNPKDLRRWQQFPELPALQSGQAVERILQAAQLHKLNSTEREK